MDVFSREHDRAPPAKALTAALAVHALRGGRSGYESRCPQRMDVRRNRPTPAPGGQVSIGAAIESFTGAPSVHRGPRRAGIITRAVKDVPVKQTGYSGLMIRARRGCADAPVDGRQYGLDSILAYSAVCAGGVDTVRLAGIRADRHCGDRRRRRHAGVQMEQAARGAMLPAPGKKAGEMPSSAAPCPTRSFSLCRFAAEVGPIVALVAGLEPLR